MKLGKLSKHEKIIMITSSKDDDVFVIFPICDQFGADKSGSWIHGPLFLVFHH